jgi:hypothetical protein
MALSLPNTIACTTIIGTPPVTTGTVVRSVAAIGVYPRLSGGPTQDDTNLEFLSLQDSFVTARGRRRRGLIQAVPLRIRRALPPGNAWPGPGR